MQRSPTSWHEAVAIIITFHHGRCRREIANAVWRSGGVGSGSIRGSCQHYCFREMLAKTRILFPTIVCAWTVWYRLLVLPFICQTVPLLPNTNVDAPTPTHFPLQLDPHQLNKSWNVLFGKGSKWWFPPPAVQQAHIVRHHHYIGVLLISRQDDFSDYNVDVGVRVVGISFDAVWQSSNHLPRPLYLLDNGVLWTELTCSYF